MRCRFLKKIYNKSPTEDKAKLLLVSTKAIHPFMLQSIEWSWSSCSRKMQIIRNRIASSNSYQKQKSRGLNSRDRRGQAAGPPFQLTASSIPRLMFLCPLAKNACVLNQFANLSSICNFLMSATSYRKLAPKFIKSCFQHPVWYPSQASRKCQGRRNQLTQISSRTAFTAPQGSQQPFHLIKFDRIVAPGRPDNVIRAKLLGAGSSFISETLRRR